MKARHLLPSPLLAARRARRRRLRRLVGRDGRRAAARRELASSGGGGGKTSLSLVAYSTPQVVYDEIIPDVPEDRRRARASRSRRSFGASGDQSRAVEAGLQADVVSFSTEPDMTRLVKAGLVAADWNAGPNKGLVTTSLVVLHRPQGQPEEHQDLGRPAQARRPGPHAEPVHLGRGEVEPARRLRPGRRRRQGPAAGSTTCAS